MSEQGTSYDVDGFRPLTYHDRTKGFAKGKGSPSEYLEQCLATIAEREPLVRAWVVLDENGARRSAQESTQRWVDGKPLSPIDGMPIGVKDHIDTKDLPTQMGCEAFRGHQPERDAPLVAALRAAGAVIVGKTVTTELGGSHPGPTKNPFDLSRSPGGSSSGSAAAVAACMVPAAIGSQVGGSITRPASYCGNIALKPSQGAIHRGDSQAYSAGTYGVLAGSLEDMWMVAIEIASRTGGDPGYLALNGPSLTPASIRPRAIAVMETAGWASLPDGARAAFEAVLRQLAERDVSILRRYDHPAIEAFETEIRRASEVLGKIAAWEGRPALQAIFERAPDKLSARAKNSLQRGAELTAGDYNTALRARNQMRRLYRALSPMVDAVITLSSLGTAPIWVHNELEDVEPVQPTGDFVFNAPSSLLGVPTVTLPLASLQGMPMGVQVMGQEACDAFTVSMARWVRDNVSPAIF